MIRAISHHLPAESYRGRVAVAYTLCFKPQGFAGLDPEAAAALLDTLLSVGERFDADVMAWCLMPDHLHALLMGRSAASDLWNALAEYKQRTGFWLSKNRPAVSWQKNYSDHLIRGDESLEVHARYIAENPVRAGLLERWWEYPWTGGSLVDQLRAAEAEH